MRLAAKFAVLSCLCAALSAQVQRSEERERVLRDVEEKAQAMRKGETLIRANVRVAVRLKNGNKLTGIVKNEQFVERLDNLDFVPAHVQSPDAGIRVWYYDNTTSYIFLPYAEIVAYRILTRLSDREVQEIEQVVERQRADAEARRKEQLAQKAATSKAAQEKAQAEEKARTESKGPPAGEPNEEEKRLLNLLEEFPPDDGWSDARAKEIERRKVVVGAYPNQQEKRFLEVLPQWLQAVELRKKLEAGKSKEKPPESKPPGAK
jgi:hypothetical protein